MSRPCFAVWMLPLVLLMGCASTSQERERPGRVVVGSGTSDDRSAISSSNEQIFNDEHALSSNAPVATSNPIPQSKPAAVPSLTPAPTPSPAPAPSPTPMPTSTSKP